MAGVFQCRCAIGSNQHGEAGAFQERSENLADDRPEE
jgi:hypothetical protein